MGSMALADLGSGDASVTDDGRRVGPWGVSLGGWTIPFKDLGVFKRFVNAIIKIEVVIYLQVVPGRAGGGSFKRKKNHIAEKEFAYRMCAR